MCRHGANPSPCLEDYPTCSQTPDFTPSQGTQPQMPARHRAGPSGHRDGLGHLEVFTEQQGKQTSNRITMIPQLGLTEREESKGSNIELCLEKLRGVASELT